MYGKCYQSLGIKSVYKVICAYSDLFDSFCLHLKLNSNLLFPFRKNMTKNKPSENLISYYNHWQSSLFAINNETINILSRYCTYKVCLLVVK